MAFNLCVCIDATIHIGKAQALRARRREKAPLLRDASQRKGCDAPQDEVGGCNGVEHSEVVLWVFGSSWVGLENPTMIGYVDGDGASCVWLSIRDFQERSCPAARARVWTGRRSEDHLGTSRRHSPS